MLEFAVAPVQQALLTCSPCSLINQIDLVRLSDPLDTYVWPGASLLLQSFLKVLMLLTIFVASSRLTLRMSAKVALPAVYAMLTIVQVPAVSPATVAGASVPTITPVEESNAADPPAMIKLKTQQA